jgi:hypothetical protein
LQDGYLGIQGILQDRTFYRHKSGFAIVENMETGILPSDAGHFRDLSIAESLFSLLTSSNMNQQMCFLG